jgi:hypothetical protein
MPIPDAELARAAYRHILCPADMTVGEAIARLRAMDGAPWWAIVVAFDDEDGARYGLLSVRGLAQQFGLLGAFPYRDVPPIAAQLDALMRRTDALADVELDAMLATVDQDAISTESARAMAEDAPGRAVAVTRAGRFVGVLRVHATRRGRAR